SAQANPQELAAMMKEGKTAYRDSGGLEAPVLYGAFYGASGGFQKDVEGAQYLTAGKRGDMAFELNHFDVRQSSDIDGRILADRASTYYLASNAGADRWKSPPRYERVNQAVSSMPVNSPASLTNVAATAGGYQPEFAGQDSVIIIQPLLPATGTGEMIIRTAGLRLEVENGKETYKKISEICQELGGYLAESNFFRDEQGRESGRVTLRVPKDKFLTALEKLDTLGKVKDSNTASQDVSQDYANLKSQLDAAKIVYDKMLEALKKRQNTIPEAIKLESELTPVLRRIDVLKNQIERLNNLTSFTTITVNFYESEVSAKVLEDTKQLIKKEMLAAKIRATRWFARNMLFVGSGIGLFVVVAAAIAMLAVWIKQLIKRN
ncbi:DUF4349 domain-containing protein, partial [bacterium]